MARDESRFESFAGSIEFGTIAIAGPNPRSGSQREYGKHKLYPNAVGRRQI